MAEFLFEIGLEEVPARMIATGAEQVRERVLLVLVQNRLCASGAGHTVFATPRRLAVYVTDVAERQPDAVEEVLGPSAKVAFRDGVATVAAEAFARKVDVSLSELHIVSTAKGDYVSATVKRVGKSAIEIISDQLSKELHGISWAKNMYWRPRKPERFVRPVRWMVALLGEQIVPVEFGGKTADAKTFGHRVLYGDEPIVLKTPGEYQDALLSGFVIADVEERRDRIRKALDKATRDVDGALWREDQGLVDKLTYLTEWPSVLMGRFEPEYLALPEEVLVTVMRDHQSYFAVDDKDGKLAPHFLAVLNTETDEAGMAVIRHGNERVLRARFNDARFFWEFDQRVPLVERVELLEHVTFQKDLGSYAEKAKRMRELCMILVGLVQGRGFVVDFNALMGAAAFAKTDLTTELVKEFTELQGEVGGLYAKAQGLREKTADAIYDHYRPESMEAPIARTSEGQLLAIADKADTIAGMFRLGLEPTGSKDPFALRRAANGIVKTLAESEVPLLLSEISKAAESFDGKMNAFFGERLEFYLREVKGQAYDVVKAVLAAGGDDVRDAVARAEAVTAVRGSEDFAAVSAAFKRMRNILAQNLDKGPQAKTFTELKEFHPAQAKLALEAKEIGERVRELKALKQYQEALETIAKLRPAVDEFFEQVMVIDPDGQVRESRLNLLTAIVQNFSGIADFSEIVVAG